MPELDAMETLYEALQHPLGLVVSVSDPVAFRQRLYTAMRQNLDVNLFTIHQSRTNSDQLLIVRKPSDVS